MSTHTSDDDVVDLVPTEVRAVIELFATELAKVSFPDVDAAALRREASELRGEAEKVARARQALEAAQAAQSRRAAALQATATRAIAYARIYAEAHPERAALASAIAALGAAPGTAAEVKPQGKRRGRPPKRSAELFDPPREQPAM
jgi:hypothetical protein